MIGLKVWVEYQPQPILKGNPNYWIGLTTIKEDEYGDRYYCARNWKVNINSPYIKELSKSEVVKLKLQGKL